MWVGTVHSFEITRKFEANPWSSQENPVSHKTVTFPGVLVEIPGTPGVVLISRDFPGKPGALASMEYNKEVPGCQRA